MTTDTEVKAAIAAERRELAAVLDSLDAKQWDAPTLCEGWRVRETTAHIVMPFRYSAPRFVWEMLRSKGNFNQMADRCAKRDAETLSAAELVAALGDNADHPWKPPGGGFAGALSHDVIHGLDITVALDLDRKVPLDRLRIILDSTSTRQVKFFGVDLDGIELRADDLDWTYGSGTPVTGAAQDLLMALCGRKLPAGRLHGEPSERFTRT
ncbi:MAG: maleylpyruvate isomerase family mycothiol-dependent enzyme [Stackebrandtia sp.]